MSESRRAFLKIAGAAAALAACTRRGAGGATLMQGTSPGDDPTKSRPRSGTPSRPSRGDTPPRGPIGGGPAPDEFDVPARVPMPMRRLGGTGIEVSCIGLGGFHLGLASEKDAMRIVHEAMDHGVTFLDNSWDYNGGESELRMGRALQGRRDKAFLMTKLDGRTADAASKQLDQSLRRLRTDHVDLLQIHEVIRPTDPGRVFAPGGAIEAFFRAREAGKTRFIGFTGHKSPAIHLAMLDEARRHAFRFDAVQMPLNVMDAQYDSFQKLVLPVLKRDHIGVLGMKPMGSGVILESGIVSGVECLRYAMSLPASVVITGVDSIGVLHQALHAALTFEPMTDVEKLGLLARVADAARKGEYEQYKTTRRFDSTAQHPQWLETAQAK